MSGAPLEWLLDNDLFLSTCSLIDPPPGVYPTPQHKDSIYCNLFHRLMSLFQWFRRPLRGIHPRSRGGFTFFHHISFLPVFVLSSNSGDT